MPKPLSREGVVSALLLFLFIASPASAEQFGGRKTIPPKTAEGAEVVPATAVSMPVTSERLLPSDDENEGPPEMSKDILEAKRRANLRAPRGAPLRTKSSVVIPGTRRPSYLPDLQSLGPLVPIVNAPLFGGSFLAGTVGSKPPDSAIAVGPLNVVTATNSGVQVFKKNGTLISSQSLATFFGSSIFTFDPKAAWDPYIQRFWILAVNFDPRPPTDSTSLTSQILIALSSTDDATDGFQVFVTDAMVNGSEATSNWCDYPQLGFDVNQIYVTCNMFTFDDNDFETSKIRIFTKSEFINNACCAWTDIWDLYDVFRHSMTIQPARMYGASPSTPMWLVNAHGQGGGDSELSVWRIDNAGLCCGAPGDPSIEGENYDVGSYDTPPDGRQPGTSTGLNTGDTRLQFGFWKNNHFGMGQDTSCNDDADACGAYTEIDLSSGIDDISTVSDFTFGNAGEDFFYPSVAPNDADNKGLVYGRSSSSLFPSTAFLGIPPSSSCTNCLDLPETMLLSGVASYVNLNTDGRNRWGDYFSAAPDPDGTGVWVHGQAGATMTTSSWQVGLLFEAMDTTAPVTTGVIDPAPNAAGWNNTNAFLDLTATDSGSGVRFLTYSATGAHPLSTTTINASVTFLFDNSEGTTTYSFFAEDFWGNQEATKTKIVRIDKSDPLLNCSSVSPIWFPDNIFVPCAATDIGPSGLANPADALFNLYTNVPDGTETASASTDSRVVCDVASNCVTAGPITPIKIDRKPPSISILTPSALPVYLLNQAVASSYNCIDGGSGVATCLGPVPSGGNLDTSTVGVQTFTVNAADQVGHASTASSIYYVTYNVCLQYDATKKHNSGSVVTIRVKLCDVNGVTVVDPSLVLTAVSVTPPGVLQPVGNSNPGNVFMQSAAGDYQYMLSTKNFAAGDYALVFTVNGDPVNHQAPFKVK